MSHAQKKTERFKQLTLFDVDDRGRQLKGWTNKLIWGDNKLIYIDPPFDVGADFSMNTILEVRHNLT